MANTNDMSAAARRARAKARLQKPDADNIPESFYLLVADILADQNSASVKYLIANITSLSAEAAKYRPSAVAHAEAALRGLEGLFKDLSRLRAPLPEQDPEYKPGQI